MSSRAFRLFLVALVSVSILAVQLQIGASSDSYYPTTYNLLGATTYVSGEITDLNSDNGVYMVFRSYASKTSPQTLYAHQETTSISETDYYLSKLESADASGENLSESMDLTGRRLWGRFLYPLTGIASIPASIWTFYYRTWHSDVTEEVLTDSPSSAPIGTWSNKLYAYLSDDNYANSSSNMASQQYSSYGFNIPSAANITKVEVGYEAHTEDDERIGITLSWDNGATWATPYISTNLGTADPNTVTWIDFTNATSWTADKLSNAKFRTAAASVQTGGEMTEVYLDWIPVRVTYFVIPSAFVDVNILIRQADGAIRETIAIDEADSGTLSTTAQTLSGTYSWSAYTVVDQTDYLEIAYHLRITTPNPNVTAYLRIDDNTLDITDQTRIANIMLPSEYAMEIESTGSSDTDSWSQLVWTVDSAWTTDNVSVTLQLYDYTLDAYSISGNGYIAYTSSAASNMDETKNQTMTTNSTDFRDSSGNWKMKIKGIKSTTSQFDFKLDLIMYEVTSTTLHDVAVLNVTTSSNSVYPGEIVTINVTVRNEGGTTETFNVTLYHESTQIGKQAVSTLAPSSSTTLTFNWNTTGVSPENYTVRAVADTIPGETDTDDNAYVDSYVEVKSIHDVSVIIVTTSTTTVTVGQTVNITVVVKNEGLVSETFNITLYYDNTQIARQLVSSLAPDANTTLIFGWNTTGVSLGTHTIKAVADEVPGETNVSDNTFSLGTIEISQPDPSITPPSILPYIFLTGIAATAVISGAIWKKKRVGSKFVGFEFFNEIIGGGIPVGSSVLIIGGPALGKSILCQQLAHKYLTEKKACIFISYDNFPSEIRENAKNFGWDLSKYEQEGDFTFIDCYSTVAGTPSQERHSVQQPFALTELNIATSTVLDEITDMPKAMFLDSATSLFTNLDASRVIKFLQDRRARMKANDGIFVFTLGKGTIAPNFINRLKETVDCIIELETFEEQGKSFRRMRVKKLRGQGHSDDWVMFKIKPKYGLVFLRPKKAK